jgi:antitoxin component YwqK of YwqJK toxin-antitoxin module
MKIPIIFLSLLVCLFSCTRNSQEDLKPQLSCLHIIDQNGFTQTIASKDRLENYKNVDFLMPQPYQKVMQVYSKDLDGSQKSFITSYHPNGYVRQYLEVVNNRAYGKYQEFDANGTLKVDTMVINGIADLSVEAEKSFIFNGVCKAYDKEGNISAIIHYEKGELEGSSITFYPNGKIAKSVCYKNNLLEGSFLIYQQDGQLLEDTQYLKGKKEGLSLIYASSGILKSQEFYNDDEILEGKYFDNKEVVISEIKNGSGFKSLFEEGRLVEKREYKKGRQEGIVEVYGKKGELCKQYHMKEGYKNGEEVIYTFDAYYERPLKKLSLNWVDGCIQGKVKTWYDNGLVEAEMEISGNKKNGNHTAWYKNGQLMFIEEYCQDQLVSGQYFKPNTFSPVSKVINGNGIATLYDGNGLFLKKITYIESKANS